MAGPQRAPVLAALGDKPQQRQLVAWRRYIKRRRRAVAEPDVTLASARSLMDLLTEHVKERAGEELLVLAGRHDSRLTSRTSLPCAEGTPPSPKAARAGSLTVGGEPRHFELRDEVLHCYEEEGGALLDMVRLVDIVDCSRGGEDGGPASSVRIVSRDESQSFEGVAQSVEDAALWVTSIRSNRTELERSAEERLARSKERRRSTAAEGLDVAAAALSERIEDYRVSRAEELSAAVRARDAAISQVVEEQVLTTGGLGGGWAGHEDVTLASLLCCCQASSTAAFSAGDDEELRRQLRRCRSQGQDFFGVAPALQRCCGAAEGRPWQGAVDELRRLETASTPTTMLSCITAMIRSIYDTVEEEGEGRIVVGADDLMPVVIYVLCQSQLPALGARLSYIEKLCDQSLIFSEEGYFFNTVAAALSFLQKLEPPPAADEDADALWDAVQVPALPAAGTVPGSRSLAALAKLLEPEPEPDVEPAPPPAGQPEPEPEPESLDEEAVPVFDATLIMFGEQEPDDSDEQGSGSEANLELARCGSAPDTVADLAADRANLWSAAKESFGAMGGASPPCSPVPRLETEPAEVSGANGAQPAKIGMVGPLDIQLGGTGDFARVHAELIGDELSFEVYDPSGAVVVRKASVLDAALSQPKNRRRGHPHAFRLDLEHPDTEGVKKYICAAATAQLCQAWRDALESHAAGGGGTVAGAAAAEA